MHSTVTGPVPRVARRGRCFVHSLSSVIHCFTLRLHGAHASAVGTSARSTDRPMGDTGGRQSLVRRVLPHLGISLELSIAWSQALYAMLASM